MAKTIVWIIVAVVVIGGGVWWWTAAHPAANSNGQALGTAEQSSAASATPLPQGDSDQAITQEMTDINAQMNGLGSDTASVDQSMNDQPVPQGQ